MLLILLIIFARMIRIFFITVSICFCLKIEAQVLVVNAGQNRIICYNTNILLGGSPAVSGGVAPYTFDWQPSLFLSSSTISNPTAVGVTQEVWYKLVVTDKNGIKDSSYVHIDVDLIYSYITGIDTGFCVGQQNGIKIGAFNNSSASSSYTFAWTPPNGLDNASSPNPIATPSVPTQYQLIVSDGICPNRITSVLVTPFIPPYADASPDTTIDEGKTITLNGTGGNKFWWQPDYNLKYGNTVNPDVWPTTTTTYTLHTEDSHKCYSSDTVRVTVNNGDLLFFYSAFTPNRDGDNDVFYIANVGKFPDNNLKIYNRYGKLIYSANNYANDWDGTYLGSTLPTGVYYYIFDDGIDKKYKGSVTILR